MLSLSDNNKADVVEAFNPISIYLDDLPTGVTLLEFFGSGIQFYLLLSPYICCISLIYLDLYVLGDVALIS